MDASQQLTESLTDDVPVRLIFPFGKLGITTYFLAVAYFVASIGSVAKVRRLGDFVSRWNTHYVFHVGMAVHTCGRPTNPFHALIQPFLRFALLRVQSLSTNISN